MSHSLFVYNPSNYPRGGWVTLPWRKIAEKTGLGPDGLLLYQDKGKYLYHQIDQLDPADPTRDTLSFFLSRPIDPGDEHYKKPKGIVFLEGQEANDERKGGPQEQKRHLEMSNSQLDIRLNLTPESENNQGCWYAGSVRSVRLQKLSTFSKDRKEFLDYLKSVYTPDDHDPEKRCMQLDSIRLSQPGLRSGFYQQIDLYNQPYRLVSEGKGPVRKYVTIASRPFFYNYVDRSATDANALRCELYRVFSLYQDREYVLEEIFLKTEPPVAPIRGEAGLYFEARYFMYLVLGSPHCCRFENVPDWFAMGDLASQLVYGFACDAHVGSLKLPHPAFPDPDNKQNALSWNLQPCQAATCLHLFSALKSTDLANLPPQGRNVLEQLSDQMVAWFAQRAGHAWYEIIYKPLLARLAEPGEATLSQGGAYEF